MALPLRPESKSLEALLGDHAVLLAELGYDLSAAPAIHRPRPADPAHRANLSSVGLSLRHFHALDFADWLEKWQRRASGEVPVKGQQAARLTEAFRSALNAGGSAAAHRLYREWYVPGPVRLQCAERTGLVRRLEQCDGGTFPAEHSAEPDRPSTTR